MSRGIYVPCAPFLYLVPDSAAPPGMELAHQRPPGPFHYLINEQAKSLVALQELQHEVGALLEFRDLVMDTFPHLLTKTTSSDDASTSKSPPPASTAASLGARREWEPGIRVRRKIPAGGKEDKVRKTVLSGDTSSAGSSAVQDSGFSTETSSSKEQCSSGVVQSPKASAIDEAEDELWNLLDVIQRKGTKLREEVESLQEKLSQDDKDKAGFEEMCKTSLGGGEGLAFMGDIIKEGLLQDFKPGGSMRGAVDSNAPQHDLDCELRELKFERDYLMDKVSEMEAETLAARAQACRLRDDLACAVDDRKQLEERMRVQDEPVLVRKPIPQRSSTFITIPSRRFKAIEVEEDSIEGELQVPRVLVEKGVQCEQETRLSVRLGTLDGVLSHPSRLPRGVVPDDRKVAAILNEFNPVELQRHLLATTVVNQDLQQRLDAAVTTNANLVQQLDKTREENDDLRFRLEERCIELEGTRAQVRVLERHQKPSVDEVLQTSVDSTADLIIAPRKRPSKIPLGTKTYVAPKPPVAKQQKEPTTVPSVKKDNFNSYKGSVGRNSSISQKNSLNGKTTVKRDSLKKYDSLSKNSYSSSLSRQSLSKKDSVSITSSNGGKKSLHRQLSSRRTAVGKPGEGDDDGGKVRPNKLAFWSNWLRILDTAPS